ncbi:WYL domain-containing protein [Nocardioides sp.]|uniref:WYL domain-containing protein n=1 Tax=Nocardioides sp. TaxID=35761 RepID=UPI0035149A8F
MTGRDQRGPMERVVRVAAALQHAGTHGVDGVTLARIAGFTGADPGTQLSRELRHLESQGWRIENVGERGGAARYVMTTVDNRLRVRLTMPQQAALRRAVLLADRADLVQRLGLPDDARPADIEAPASSAAALVDPARLGRVVDAVREQRLLRFGYKGTPRVVHPESVRNQNGTWYLRGLEDGAVTPLVKAFVVSRMSDPVGDRPGSAQRVQVARHPGLHPMTWQVDEPIDVELETEAAFVPDVERWLGPWASREAAPASTAPTGEAGGSGEGGERVRLRYRVTHRAALRARLNELGRRVRIVGPPEIRAEILASLAAAAGIDPAEGES